METIKGKRERYSAIFKARVAIEAIKERESLRELSSKFKVSIATISKWKEEFLEHSNLAFGSSISDKSEEEHSKEIKDLQAKIGELTMERDFFVYACKKAGLK